jgi:hypothetical protein
MKNDQIDIEDRLENIERDKSKTFYNSIITNEKLKSIEDNILRHNTQYIKDNKKEEDEKNKEKEKIQNGMSGITVDNNNVN